MSELRSDMQLDPVVAAQFQGFDFQHARLLKVSQKEAMYVSYRIGQKVYWTRKKVWLHPGETLISDGNIVARTRCGNRVAKVPLNSGSPLEPPEEDFNQPYSAMIAAPQSAPVLASPPGDPAATAIVTAAAKRRWWILPLFAAPLAALPHSGSSSSEPLAVAPEPGSLLLLVSGLGGVYWKVRHYRKKS